MTDAKHKWQDWRALAKVVPEPEDPEVIGGRNAELFLQRMVKNNLRFKSAYFFHSKRVPSPAERRRYEIDLIVLTKKQIHIIEVKNLSGAITANADKWIQTKRNGMQVLMESPIVRNDRKMRVLETHLQKCGVDLDSSYFSQRVVLMNPNVNLCRVVAHSPRVIQRHQLDKYLKRSGGIGFGEQLIHSVIEYCLDTEASDAVLDGMFQSMTSSMQSRIRHSLGCLETFDKVLLYGGKVLPGDILDFRLSRGPISLAEIQSGEVLSLRWSRNRLLGIANVVLDRPLGILKRGKTSQVVAPGDSVYFHKVGEKSPMHIDLARVDALIKG
ncbi:MAG: hypothetical protein AMXMBFR82_29580 [Candidatus Hydrogenedentota bacterium]